ncbi:hypothetical protein, partial [Citrobacter youngae]|uniref:hypothetical protein n=1 Tax=Citrobacter youngae TaxID=133448 RepID=UPI001EF97667
SAVSSIALAMGSVDSFATGDNIENLAMDKQLPGRGGPGHDIRDRDRRHRPERGQRVRPGPRVSD